MSYWDDLIINWINSGGTAPCDWGSDEGWDNFTARWKVVADDDAAIIECIFRWQDVSNHYKVTLTAADKKVRLYRTRGGVATLLATSAEQAYLKVGVQDSIRVDTFVGYELDSVVARVLLDGEVVIGWTRDMTPGPLGGPVGFRSQAGGGWARLKMCEVTVWPVESGTRLLTGDV